MYKAYIASGKGTQSTFDSATGKTKGSAIGAVKRKNSPDWKDCYVWCVLLHENGTEEQL